MNDGPFHITFHGLILGCITAAIIVSGCSSVPGEPPNTIQVAEFNSALESFGEGKWNSITLTVTPKNTIDVQIHVMSETHAIALNAYCNVVRNAFADAGLTDYRLKAAMRLDGQSDKTC